MLMFDYVMHRRPTFCSRRTIKLLLLLLLLLLLRWWWWWWWWLVSSFLSDVSHRLALNILTRLSTMLSNGYISKVFRVIQV